MSFGSVSAGGAGRVRGGRSERLSEPSWRCDVAAAAFSRRVPLEKDNSEEFRQRELRAAQLAREIESSPQYRLRIAMENDDGRTEEEKHSAVQRQGSGRESPSLAAR